MSATITTRQVGDVTVVDAAGKITLGEGSAMLRDQVRNLLGAGNRKILINLGEVNYIDSSGIGELVSCFTSVTGVLQAGHARISSNSASTGIPAIYTRGFLTRVPHEGSSRGFGAR